LRSPQRKYDYTLISQKIQAYFFHAIAFCE